MRCPTVQVGMFSGPPVPQPGHMGLLYLGILAFVLLLVLGQAAVTAATAKEQRKH